MQDVHAPEIEEQQLHNLFLATSVEDVRPTYAKDAIDDEFHLSNGLSFPKYMPGAVKSRLALTTSKSPDIDSLMDDSDSQVCLKIPA